MDLLVISNFLVKYKYKLVLSSALGILLGSLVFITRPTYFNVSQTYAILIQTEESPKPKIQLQADRLFDADSPQNEAEALTRSLAWIAQSSNFQSSIEETRIKYNKQNPQKEISANTKMKVQNPAPHILLTTTVARDRESAFWYHKVLEQALQAQIFDLNPTIEPDLKLIVLNEQPEIKEVKAALLYWTIVGTALGFGGGAFFLATREYVSMQQNTVKKAKRN
ncbi:hypothetical protein H6802_00575 [Candidatus Nomurabacteria bacterium]|uniref:Uncharacterized protein n=1 Tax=candidate division WWE3 bacterium TaxID=2053526 RepID=A0A955E1J2_UNCKA|nr:hypothetical protein [candidate division WWE3 bacterium]MCB9823444.1 hypothetical protein [Candidatus Nomurabacteria bacterium]MCB9827726.1 hypothetical protein [Candidatus Nomurabacteria bacterium]HXK52992.1 hypothetical protein [bacterium]